MARIRNIKPEFFLHEGLADLPHLHRLAFIGLWTLADKDGRLEDRPKRIKAALFPYENIDIETVLGVLDGSGFIHRYVAAGVACIEIPGFSKHQRPHPKEGSYGLPSAPSREVSRLAVKRHSTIPSSPARNGEWRMENGSLENGDPPSAPAAPVPVDAPPTTPDIRALNGKQPKPEKPTDPRHAPLVKALVAAFPGYAFKGRDAKAVAELLAMAEPPEVERRWKLALKHEGFPTVRTLAELVTHWNHFAATGPPRPTKGRASEADKDWTNYEPNAAEF